MPFRRALVWVVLMGLFGGASATVCEPELERALPAEGGLGVVAAELLMVAVQQAEPALPPFRAAGELPLAEGDPGYGAARWLSERRLLPDRWRPDTLPPEVWRAMLGRFQGWYRLDPVDLGPADSPEALVADLARVLERVAGAVRPAALIATAPDDPEEVAFRGIIWNWTPYPRLLLLRPGRFPDDGDVQAILERTGTCVIRPSAYLMADAETATRLFLGNNASRVRLVGAEPGRDDVELPFQVPSGEELTYFGFDAPEMRRYDVASVVFDGPSAGVGTVLLVLRRVKTNITPLGYLHYLAIP